MSDGANDPPPQEAMVLTEQVDPAQLASESRQVARLAFSAKADPLAVVAGDHKAEPIADGLREGFTQLIRPEHNGSLILLLMCASACSARNTR